MKPVDIDIELNGCDFRKMVEFGVEDGKRERHYLYYDGEAVSGKVQFCFNLKSSVVKYTVSGKNDVTLFLIITLVSLGGFL